MNHAFVFAAQQFLGFELCDALLEEGWTVTAIDEDKGTKDKWMEIGRNANLEYVPYGEWDRDVRAGSNVFLPYYDQLRGDKVSYLSEVETLVSKKNQPFHVIRIYPNEKGNEDVKEDGTSFYLPTLYGIHQPEEFLFAQLLTGREEISEYVDDPSGAIYVKDAARTIVNLSMKKERFSLKPLSNQSWKEALSYITNETFSDVPVNSARGGEEVIVRPSKSHKSIIEEQKEGIRIHENQE
ncbi:hypothetical protein CN378_14050 [Bacillus sp. AFS015802]|uniref:hypothetical protein n=1 Tax=Bacillus sp. AFS015802 TaxID=2033486 RepID=UPI000BF85B08|nr:hypothetical protein [Bacillus sp. AFS015802]PFA66414.1 hypothetical protein CN378_14050 [Bacillus sp. AFS015802]